jgi:hypothetical protein
MSGLRRAEPFDWAAPEDSLGSHDEYNICEVSPGPRERIAIEIEIWQGQGVGAGDRAVPGAIGLDDACSPTIARLGKTSTHLSACAAMTSLPLELLSGSARALDQLAP